MNCIHSTIDFKTHLEEWAFCVTQEGYEVIGTYDADTGGYEWDMRVLFKDGDKLFWVGSSGCSCYGPGDYDIHDLIANPYVVDMEEIRNYVFGEESHWYDAEDQWVKFVQEYVS